MKDPHELEGSISIVNVTLPKRKTGSLSLPRDDSMGCSLLKQSWLREKIQQWETTCC